MPYQINCLHGTINLQVPQIMGILNVTPDSFFDGGKHDSISRAIEKAIQLKNDGATIIDIGGQSTRPNATLIAAAEELDRIATVIEGIRNFDKRIIISVDTFYSHVGKHAIALGADIINDVSAGEMDDAMMQTVADLQVPYMMMHMQGTPSTMQLAPSYSKVSQEVYQYLENKMIAAKQLGIQQLIIDPGFGFGKTTAHNFELFANLEKFQDLQTPLLVGISRKGMIYKTLGIQAAAALNGTSALHMAALQKGANILRVHDVKEAKEVITLFNEVEKYKKVV